MSDDRLDELLQDYLDGRLSGREKAAFEERLGSDPDLATRLAAYRSIGRALRETPADLPPGFYARARERFETAHAPRLKWRFLLRWETVGVAAAGLLLVAVMLPEIMRGNREDLGAPIVAPARKPVPVRTLPPVEKEPAAPEEKTLQPPNVEARKDVPLDKRGAPRPEAAEGAGYAAVGEEEAREGPEEQEALTTESFAPAPPLPERAAVGDDEAGAGRNVVGSDVDTGAKRKKEQAEKSARLDAPAAAAPSLRESPESDRDRQPTGIYRRAAHTLGGAEIVVIEGGGLAVGSVTVIENDDAWNALPAGIREALARPDDWAKWRWVLIGPRERPIRCDSLEIVSEADRVLIGVLPAGERPADEACALRLEPDGRPVEVVDAGDPDR